MSVYSKSLTNAELEEQIRSYFKEYETDYTGDKLAAKIIKTFLEEIEVRKLEIFTDEEFINMKKFLSDKV